jgi:hypothetical protein
MPEAEPEAALLHTWGDEPVRGWTPLTGAGEGGSRRGERGNGM